jgi:hypothetical protein
VRGFFLADPRQMMGGCSFAPDDRHTPQTNELILRLPKTFLFRGEKKNSPKRIQTGDPQLAVATGLPPKTIFRSGPN